MNKINYKKRSILLTLASFVNLGLCVLFFLGAKFFVQKGNDNFIAMKDLAKEKGITVAEELYNKFKKSDEVRKDSPEVLAREKLYDAKIYDLNLWFDLSAKSIKGELIMKATSLSDTLNIIYMNLYDNMKVSNVSFMLIPESADSVLEISQSNNWSDLEYRQENNYLIISTKNSVLKNIDFLVRVNYSGTPKKLGFDSFSFKEIYGNTVIYNLSEPNYGPAWWPSKDLPEDKAFTVMHLNAPAGMTGVSNGTLKDTLTNSDGTKTFTWKSSYPIATYLVSLVVTKFSYWEGSYTSVDGTKQMPLTYYVFPHDSVKSRTDWKVTPTMLGFLSKTFGEYAFIDEKYGMAQFGWTNGSMEHQTITSMGYLLMTGDNAYDNVVVHEMAHQWFGDAVTLKDWKNIWLNEGFASYCEALWEENLNGKQAYFEYMKNFDYGFFSGTVYAPDGFIDSPPIYATVYQKGAWVLHMLRGVLGDEVFFKAMRTYYDRFKYKNAETSDFIDVVEEISGKKLDWFFDEWVYKGAGRPKYEYSWKFEDFQGTNNGKYTVRLQLKQVQDEYGVYKMPIKINVVTKSGSQAFNVFNDTKEQNFLFAVDSEPKEVQIDPDGWILKKIAKGKY